MKAPHNLQTCALLWILLALLVPRSTRAEPPTDAQRLERLAERLEEARLAQNIPGCAIAVVRDGEVIFARGFGLADVEQGTPVTPETVFSIGSTTKAFTSALIGMLVDDGVMSLDDPVSRWLPDFTPSINGGSDDVLLLRDLLSHRTGFTRMGMLFISGEVGREEILQAASRAEPRAPFRKLFLYNNVMYIAAGTAAGAAFGGTWESAMQERILDPLGMSSATLSAAAMRQEPDRALGYAWEDERGEWKPVPLRDLDALGPAGGINASVLDVARWIRFLLDGTRIEGKRQLTEETLAELWSEGRGRQSHDAKVFLSPTATCMPLLTSPRRTAGRLLRPRSSPRNSHRHRSQHRRNHPR